MFLNSYGFPILFSVKDNPATSQQSFIKIYLDCHGYMAFPFCIRQTLCELNFSKKFWIVRDRINILNEYLFKGNIVSPHLYSLQRTPPATITFVLNKNPVRMAVLQAPQVAKDSWKAGQSSLTAFRNFICIHRNHYPKQQALLGLISCSVRKF